MYTYDIIFSSHFSHPSPEILRITKEERISLFKIYVYIYIYTYMYLYIYMQNAIKNVNMLLEKKKLAQRNKK
jgi:hypothetical protein